jgi:hypothetical protein
MKLPGTIEVRAELEKLLAEPTDGPISAVYDEIAARSVLTMYRFVIAASEDKDLMDAYIRGLEHVKLGAEPTRSTNDDDEEAEIQSW